MDQVELAVARPRPRPLTIFWGGAWGRGCVVCTLPIPFQEDDSVGVKSNFHILRLFIRTVAG